VYELDVTNVAPARSSGSKGLDSAEFVAALSDGGDIEGLFLDLGADSDGSIWCGTLDTCSCIV
jgi:hypothetical protein